MRLSIVIPTLDEEAAIGRTLEALRHIETPAEVVVVDGGSRDRTVSIASAAGATVIRAAERGRAAQLNHGALESSGDVLVFLHADTVLPPDAARAITDALSHEDVVGGCFRLRFDHDHPLLRLSSILSALQFPLFHFGDSAYFMRRSAFEALGGYRSLPLMEDLEFWLRLNRFGKTTVVRAVALTSARRFRRHGVVRQQGLGLVLVVLFLLRADPGWLAWAHERLAPRTDN